MASKGRGSHTLPYPCPADGPAYGSLPGGMDRWPVCGCVSGWGGVAGGGGRGGVGEESLARSGLVRGPGVAVSHANDCSRYAVP